MLPSPAGLQSLRVLLVHPDRPLEVQAGKVALGILAGLCHDDQAGNGDIGVCCFQALEEPGQIMQATGNG